MNRAQQAGLTRRQRTVLHTLYHGQKMTAREIGVRSDVLWRLEERGMVARGLIGGRGRFDDVWHILPLGREELNKARGWL